MRIHLILAAGLLALTGCASSAAAAKPKGVAKFEGDPRLGEQVDKICFASNIDSFGDTTKDTFTVRNGRDHYMIQIFGSCAPLDHAMSIAMVPHTSCLSKGDNVIVSDSLTISSGSSPFSTQRCLVDQIYKWDPKAGADDDKDSGDSGEES